MYCVCRIFLAVVLIVALAEGSDNPYRLPTTTKPAHYEIILKIDPDQQNSFSGRVSINLFAQNSTDYIVLHSNVTSIENISVKEGSNDLYLSHNIAGDDTHFLNVYLTKNLTLNQLYVLKISYIGKYGDSVDGLYLSTYKDVDGRNKNLAVTQMAPADARKVFPCYDEPSFKATFQINVYAPEGYQVISNEDVTAESELPEIEDGLLLTTFKETPPMSTYLIALLVSNYTYKSNLEQGDQIFSKKYRVFARPGVEDEMNFALQFGQMAMNILENYTTVEYVFSKLDNAALPNLYYNAMENWGLIIYREPRLLYNENTTKTKDLQATAIVIAHESAHMWFGNHVTPQWWDFVWLSEGFATYFESFVTNAIAPEWRLMDQFTINNNHRAMKIDSTNSTNPMTNPLGPPQQLVDNFNLIAYQKAASVIRMIQHVMGEADFHTGVVNYLTSIPLGNSEPSILFDGLQKAIDGKEIFPQNVSVADVFSTWSDQKGFPVIKVTRTNGNGEIHLTQQRYHDSEAVTTSEKYWIPINWATSNNITFQDTSAQIWFDPKIDILKLPLVLNENDWLILNKQQTGYYRVLYDISTWNLISEALKSEDFRDIHFLNRAQLIDDSMNFAQTLRISYNVTLNLLSYLHKELDFIPWSSAYNGLKILDTLMPAAENFNKYKKFIINITKEAFESLGLDENEKDDPITKMNRITIGELACNAGSAECRNRANDKLLSIMNNNASSLEVNLKELIYCAGIRDATENIWDYFWLEYLNSSQSSEKTLIIKGLGCSESRPIIQRYLHMAVSENVNIGDPDRTAIVQSVINSGPTGIDIVLDFLNTDFTSLQSTTQTVAIITNLANKVVTKENVNKFKEFAANPSLTPDERKATDSAIETIKQNTDWLEMTLIDIDPWLNDYV